jgi:hypothetical protein
MMLDECPMTEDCPGYDRDRRMCLLRPDDCEFAPTDDEAIVVVETPEALKTDASAPWDGNGPMHDPTAGPKPPSPFAWGLYVLLRPVNKDLALLFLLLNVVGVAIQCASMMSLVSAMLQGDGASHLQAYSAAQLDGLAYLSINVYKTGFVTAQLFFGTWLFPLGYLVYKSKSLPWLLGVLLVLDGIAELIWFLQALILPAYPAIHLPGVVVSFVAEVGLALWLLVKGVKVVGSGPGQPGQKRDATTDTSEAT